MSRFIAILVFYTVAVALPTLLAWWRSGWRKSFYWDDPSVLLAPTSLLLLGLAAGLIIDLIIEKPALKNRNYNISIFIALFAFVTFTSVTTMERNLARLKETFNDQNDDYFSGEDVQELVRKKLAYHTLARQLGGEDSLLLQGGSGNKRDTVVDGLLDSTFRIIYFYRKPNREGLFKATINVWREKASLVALDQVVTQHELEAMDSTFKEVVRQMKKSLESLPEKDRKELPREVEEILDP